MFKKCVPLKLVLTTLMALGSLSAQAAGSGQIYNLQPILECGDGTQIRVNPYERRELSIAIKGDEAKRTLFAQGAAQIDSQTVDMTALSFFFSFANPNFYNTVKNRPDVVLGREVVSYGSVQQGVFAPSQFAGFLGGLYQSKDEVRVLRNGQQLQIFLYRPGQGDLASYEWNDCREL